MIESADSAGKLACLSARGSYAFIGPTLEAG
jgi:hypothetical protein